jgi:hypothetical protein
MILTRKGSRSNKTSLDRRKELKKLPISEKSVMARQRLKDREPKTNRGQASKREAKHKQRINSKI